MSTDDTRYRAIFRRHRLLLSAPIVLGVLLSAWTVVGAPKTYQSTATAWFDNAPPNPSSATQSDPALRPPAAQQQLILTELQSTRTFRLNVGRNSPLAGYLATHSKQGFGPTALLSKGGGSLDQRIISALGPKQVTTTVLGPQVLSVSVIGPTPAVAQGTLKSLLEEFDKEESGARLAQARAAHAYYNDLAKSAQQEAASAQANIDKYVAAHPTRSDSDPTLATLTQAASAATAKLADVNNSLNESSIILAQVTNSDGLRTLDPPNLPTGAAGGGKKKMVLGGVAGLMAGGLLSLLGLVAFAAKQRRALSPEAGGAGMDVASPPTPTIQPWPEEQPAAVGRRADTRRPAAPVAAGAPARFGESEPLADDRATAVVGDAFRVMRPRTRPELRNGKHP